MNLEDIVKYMSHKRTNKCLHLREAPSVVKFIDTESKMVVARAWEEEKMQS